MQESVHDLVETSHVPAAGLGLHITDIAGLWSLGSKDQLTVRLLYELGITRTAPMRTLKPLLRSIRGSE